jgi:hypothetical protein
MSVRPGTSSNPISNSIPRIPFIKHVSQINHSAQFSSKRNCSFLSYPSLHDVLLSGEKAPLKRPPTNHEMLLSRERGNVPPPNAKPTLC